MEIPLLDLQAQYRELKDEIDDAVDSVMTTAGFIGGPRVAEFEDAMADYCGTGHAVSCANGTDALILILESLGVGPGHEVITSPFTFFATAEAVARVGAVPVFVDIEPDTYNVDPARIEAAITDRTRAVMPVHIFGQCADIDAVRDVAAPRELFVVEDACQAIGATYRGKKAGSLADAAAFSFFPSKNLGGAGDGGMVTTDDADLAARVRLLANHGSSEKYIHAAVGHNSRLDALQAAVLDVKLKYLDRWNASRREAAAVYDELLAGLPVTTPSTRAYGDSAYHLYIVRTPKRDAVMSALRSAGIGTAAYYPLCLHLQEAFAGLGYRAGDLPVAEATQDETFAIPAFPGMTREQQERVASVLESALR